MLLRGAAFLPLPNLIVKYTMNVTDRIVLVSDHIRTEDHIVDGKVTVPGLTNLLTYKGYPFWWALGNPRSTLDSPRVIDSFLNSIIKLRISDDHAPDIVQIRSRIIKAHFPAFFLWFLNSSDFEYFENITSFSQSVINKRCFCYVDEEKSKLERKRWTFSYQEFDSIRHCMIPFTNCSDFQNFPY